MYRSHRPVADVFWSIAHAHAHAHAQEVLGRRMVQVAGCVSTSPRLMLETGRSVSGCEGYTASF